MAQMLAFSGFLAVLLRAAILCFQTVVIGGLFFFILVARGPQSRDETLLRSGWKLVRWSALGLALRIGTELVVAIVVGTGIGWALDRWLGTHWLAFVFFFLGVGIGTVLLLRSLRG